MKKTNFRSPKLKFLHKLVRFKVLDPKRIEEIKAFLLEQYNEFLQINEG
jgi:hypothetical protein